MILKSGTREMKAMSDTILKVTNVTKRFGGVCALDNVNLELKKGEIHCLVGGNGSGKSTLIKIISGFYKPDGGTVEIDGIRHTQKYSTMDASHPGAILVRASRGAFHPKATISDGSSRKIARGRYPLSRARRHSR